MSTRTPTTEKAAPIIARDELEPEHLELLDNFDRNTLKNHNDIKDSSREKPDSIAPHRDESKLSEIGAYSVEFIGQKMIIADRLLTDISSVLKMDRETVEGFKSTVTAIAKSGSRSPSTLRNSLGKIVKALRDEPIPNFDPETYPKLIRTCDDITTNVFRNFLSLWHRLGYPGVDAETMDVIEALKRPSVRGRSRVTSDDQTEGWYTTQEYDDLVDIYWTDYESGKLPLRDTAMLLLNAQFGRRGVQLSSLKICDFEHEGSREGISGKRIVFPGAKDRSAEEWFRGSKPDVHPIGDELWDLCQLQIANSIGAFEKVFGREASESVIKQIPFIMKTFRGKALRAMQTPEFSVKDRLATSYFHLSAGTISNILSREDGTRVFSVRTGEPLREFGYRMRHTRARQLARLGVPRLTLQYWLGHEKENSLAWYYNDPAEDARQLNEQVQSILAPLAQAFSGAIRDKEADATRGNDPSSRVELDGRQALGSCGEHGYCSASVPIPCYRCSKFEPWVDGPHDEVLIRLIERQEEESNVHIPSKARRILVPLQLGRDIEAVKLVIRLCDARKLELLKNESKNNQTSTSQDKEAKGKQQHSASGTDKG
jgi:integrase